MYAESSVGCLLCYCGVLGLKIAHHSAVAQVNSTVPPGNHFPRWCMLEAVTFQNSPNLFLHFQIRPFELPRLQTRYKSAPLLQPKRYRRHVAWAKSARISSVFPPTPSVLLILNKHKLIDYRHASTVALDNTLGYTHLKQVKDADTGLRCHEAML